MEPIICRLILLLVYMILMVPSGIVNCICMTRKAIHITFSDVRGKVFSRNNILEERAEDSAGTVQIVVAYPGTDIEPETVTVSYYENNTAGASPVIAYKYRKQP